MTLAVVAALAVTAPAWAGPGNPLDGIARLREGRTERSASTLFTPDWRSGEQDWKDIRVGETLVLADLKGPGIITHIWNTFGGGERNYSRLIRLRMYWDGEKEPSVDAPIGDFFGAGHGKDAIVSSLPIEVSSSGRARNSFWPMPFRKSARVTVTNEGTQTIGMYYYVDWQRVPRLDADIAYFHAQYHQEYPTTKGRNYVVADITGRGHYVGTVLSNQSRAGGWWGEGDDHFYVDGETNPSIKGTGTEDYFSDAFGVWPHLGHYYGTTVWESNEAENGQTTVYRWQIPDPVIFQKSLRFELEHKGVTWNPDGTIKSHTGERQDHWSTVAFWYQTEPHKPFPPMPVGYDRMVGGLPNMVEAEGLLGNARATEGAVERQDLGGKSGGAQLFWKPDTAGQSLTVPFDVKEAGRYNLELLLTRSWDYGTYQVELDGKSVSEPLDLYEATTREHALRLRDVALSAGRHTLRFVNKGKAEASPGYYLGVDALRLTSAP
jgi:hypothetical protein